jgi:predicted ATP-dependent endonuclease of OLD family
MLFAKNIILVEGLAEQLLLPTMAKYCSRSFEDTHTTVIHVGGRYFDHFIKLFDTTNPNAINKKVACITDRDPTRKKKGPNEKLLECYPFEMNKDPATYDYKYSAEDKIIQYNTHPNIRFFSQDSILGKTLEYELMLRNPACTLLLTDGISNKDELTKLFTAFHAEEKTIETIKSEGIMRKSEENDRILDGLIACSGEQWRSKMKVQSLLAARYLNCVDKGSNALELALALEKNIKEREVAVLFRVPDYIKSAISWVCQ